jgi:hypothetical protein
MTEEEAKQWLESLRGESIDSDVIAVISRKFGKETQRILNAVEFFDTSFGMAGRAISFVNKYQNKKV